MCGIAGIWSKTRRPASVENTRLMLSHLIHRGPDADGIWNIPNLVLGHRRLKIIDLSDSANQPFTDGNDALVFNGEIFNYRELQSTLSSRFQFRTKSDTEVLFRMLQVWGEVALEKIEGQFAFAFYSKESNTVLLARDHVGICPLYIMEDDTAFYFASEIKPLLLIKKSPLDRQGIIDYFTFRYNIQNGRTLFENIRRATPAYYIKIDLSTGRRTEKKYWQLRFEEQFRSAEQVDREFAELFNDEVKHQQMADVPFGLYLSGGIDSGALLSGFARAQQDIKAFTLSFTPNDEDSMRVSELSKAYKFNKNQINFSADNFSTLEETVGALEEPFGDLIICANDDLARHASKELKVVLTGEGGDEAFCGYDHQRAFLKMARIGSCAPLRLMLVGLLKTLPPILLAVANDYPGGFGRQEQRRIGGVFEKLGSPVEAYIQLVSLFSSPELPWLFSKKFSAGTALRADADPIREIFASEKNILYAVMRSEIEQLTLIVNLLKQDRFTMRYSLEGRVPFVSRRVLEFCSHLPYREIVSKTNKRILIDYAQRCRLKKKPFSITADPKYVASMRKVWSAHVSQEVVEDNGILSWKAVEQIEREMLNGGILSMKKAMAVLVFFVWIRYFNSYIEPSRQRD